VDDPYVPVAGGTVFYLVTGLAGNRENSLGPEGSGVERPDGSPCP